MDEFVDQFCEKLELLRPHSFIANQQALFYSNCKLGLAPREMLVIVDFSENYSFVLQDAAQGFHWNNSQATIHPFVAYFKNHSELCHISYVIVSECLHHDTTAVYLYQKCFIAFYICFSLPDHNHEKSPIFLMGLFPIQHKKFHQVLPS